ncbi:hypothetical protein ACKKBG_A31050 [Auxenochlorella protothecoides x Auxenochlorella symbiontica]
MKDRSVGTSTGPALLALGQSCEAQGCYCAAARCYAAIPGTTQTAPVYAQAALHLARLLLARFENVPEALSALHTATLHLRASNEETTTISCQLHDCLADCHRAQGEPELELKALRAGLEACARASPKADRPTIARWRSYFLFRALECAAAGEDEPALTQALGELQGTRADLTAVEQVLVDLCHCTVLLARRRFDAALSQAGATLPAATAAAAALPVGTGDALAWHARFLALAARLQAGELVALQPPDCPSLVDLQGALEIGSRDGAPRWPYRWIAPAALSALLHTYHASLLLASGKTAAAAAALREAGGPEADLQPWARRLARRQAAVQALACCDLAGAARLLVDAWSTDDEAGGAEPQPSPAWTLLAGLYLATLGRGPAARHLLAASGQNGPPAVRHLAAFQTSVHCLEAGDLEGAEATLRAFGTDPALSPLHERAAQMLAQGLLALAKGDAVGAKLVLSRCLKLAHRRVGNTQLVAQVLNVLGPLLASQGDREGADQMLTSSATLSRALGDAPSLLAALRAACEAGIGTDAEQGAAYLAKKEGQLAERVGDVVGSGAHAELVQVIHAHWPDAPLAGHLP